MKSQKGMGHLTTILSIVIIILIISGITHYVKDEMQEGKIQNYETDMLLIQGKVKVLSQESTIKKNEELLKGKKVEENLEDEEIKSLLENNIISQGEEKFSKYYILEQENINEIGLNNVELDKGHYIVNYATYEIIYSKGINIEGNIYYKLSEIQEQTKHKEEQIPQEELAQNEESELTEGE